MVEASLKAYGFEPDPKVAEIFTKYRKTHNDGVFDAYTPDIRKCRSSHIITGLPDNYGRGRIIGDYRRVALYGMDFLIKEQERDKAELDDRHSTEEVIRLREELAEQIRALKELKQMGKNYGFDIWPPGDQRARSDAVALFRISRGIKQQNGAAMSVGRVIHVPRHLFRARPARGHAHRERGAGDHRRLRHQAPPRALPAGPRIQPTVLRRPGVGDRVVGGMGDDGRTLVTKSNFRMLNTLYTLGPRPSRTSPSSGRRGCRRPSNDTPPK